MQKLASSIVKEGALALDDAVGWVVRLANTLEVIQVHGRAHGRVSAKAVQILGRSCHAAGFFLDTPDLVDDVAYHSPDRIAGAQPSPEDDTWALGVLLYFALTGVLPFAGMSSESVGAEMLAAEIAPLSSFGINEPRLQQILDTIFTWDPNVRLHTARTLRAKLCEAFPFVAALPPLKLGKPNIALFDEDDEEDDDEGQKLTAVLNDDPSILQARIEHAKAKAAAKKATAAAAPAVPPGAPEEEPSEEEPEGGIVDELSLGDLPVVPLSQMVAASAAGEAPRARRRDAEPSAPAMAGRSGPLHFPAESERAPEASARADSQATREISPAAPVPDRAPPAVAPQLAPPPQAAFAPAAPAAQSARAVPARSGSGGRFGDVVLGALFLAVGGLGAYLLFGPKPSAAGPAAGVLATSAVVAPSAPGPGSAAPSATGSSGPAGAGSSTASGLAVRKAPADFGSCMQSVFPPGTFPSTANSRFDFVCTQVDARKGGHSMRALVVRAGAVDPKAADAMREWALFSWYEMAAFEVARLACCKAPPRLATTMVPKVCLLDQALTTLGRASIGTDAAAVKAAVKGYQSVVNCLLRAGAASAFGRSGAPDPGAITAFESYLARVRKAQGL